MAESKAVSFDHGIPMVKIVYGVELTHVSVEDIFEQVIGISVMADEVPLDGGCEFTRYDAKGAPIYFGASYLLSDEGHISLKGALGDPVMEYVRGLSVSYGKPCMCGHYAHAHLNVCVACTHLGGLTAKAGFTSEEIAKLSKERKERLLCKPDQQIGGAITVGEEESEYTLKLISFEMSMQ